MNMNNPHEKLKNCEVKTCSGILYNIDEETIEELVKEYFDNSNDKRKGFNNFFNYIGIEPYDSTTRGEFEYEAQFISHVIDVVEKYQKLNRYRNKLKRKYGGNLLDGVENESSSI